MQAAANVFADVLPHLPEECFTTLWQAVNVRIERIVSHGHTSPEGFWYDQDQHEWVLLLQGAATLQFDTGDHPLKPGDYIHIPAQQRHRVAWTDPNQPTIWLAVHYAAFTPNSTNDSSQSSGNSSLM